MMFVVQSTFANCTYCTNLKEALSAPEKVRHLDFSAQGLVSIPEEINQFVNLISLDLSDNLINEIEFLTIQLPTLQGLDVSRNPGIMMVDLSGIGDAFPALKNLDASHCSIRYIGKDISTLKNLEELVLRGNSLEWLPIEMKSLGKLAHLDVSANNLKEVYWLKDLWGVERLDISGNAKLKLREVGMAILLNEKMEVLTITPDDSKKGVPDVFSSLSIQQLVFKGGRLGGINNKLPRNGRIKHVVFDNVECTNMDLLYGWVNRFSGLSVVEFRNMELADKFNSMINIDELRLVKCTFQQKELLQKVRPTVRISAMGTDIRTPGYVGNAQIASSTAAVSDKEHLNVEMSEEMRTNTLEPIIKAEEQTLIISGSAPRRVTLDFSEYDIPSQAFLTQEGNIYKGEVELKITEYDDPIMNALAGAPMIYRTEETDNVFASSGMINFRAFDDQGNELNPNPESVIQVEIKDLQPSETPQLYVFDTTENNWNVQPTPPVTTGFNMRKKRIMDSLNKLPDNQFYVLPETTIGIALAFKKSKKDPYLLEFETIGRWNTRSIKSLQRYEGRVARRACVDQQWLAKKIDWKVDTVMTAELSRVLKTIKTDQKKHQKYWQEKNRISMDLAPRLITDLSITPDLEKDNYRLKFKYKDSLISIPVYADFGGSIKRIQDKERKNYNRYLKLKKEADKERELVQKHNESVEKELVKKARDQRANMLLTYGEFERARQEKLAFGLTSFGLVNCDYFSRNVPDDYMAVDTLGTDQYGNWVRIPPTVRNIYLDDNSFVSTSSEKIPVYRNKKSIVLFALGALEVAVIKGWKRIVGGKSEAEIVRFSTEGLSPDEVSKKILNMQQ